MKIGFFTDGYVPQPNGVATSVYSSAKALEKRGHEVYVIAPKQPGYIDEKNVYRLTSLKFYGKADFRIALNLPEKPLREILKLDFEIVHGHAGGPVTFLVWQVARLKNVPFVGTYHTLWNRYTHYILKGRLIRPKMAEVASKIFGNLCDLLIAPTPKVKEELISYGVKKPIEVVGSGLDLDRFGSGEKGFLRKRLGLKDGEPILLYVGRVGREKSVDFLLKAFSQIHNSHPRSHLVLVGDGTDREKLEKVAKKLKIAKNTHFTGFIDQKYIQKVYPDADIFVFSSQTETQGLVIIEAFASGLPVVAVKDAAFEGVVINDKNGFLVKKDPKAFANKVSFLLDNDKKREELAKNARETAQDFSVEITAEKLEIIYKKIIASYRNKKRLREKIKDLRSFMNLTTRVNKLKNILIYPYFGVGNER